MLGSSYPLLNAFWTILYIFVFILWLSVLFRVIWDIFRSQDLSGLGKAGWLLFILFIPLVGVFAYVIFRGGSMHEREVRTARMDDNVFRSYIQEVGGSSSIADEIAKLADLKEKGVISEADFDRAKDKLLT